MTLAAGASSTHDGETNGKRTRIRAIDRDHVACRRDGVLVPTAQAAFSQYVAVWAIQASGAPDVLVFKTSGASPDGHSPTTAAYATTNYRVQIGVNTGAGWQQVLWQETALNLLTTVLFESFGFISQDSTDRDFNDTHLSPQWVSRLG